MFSPKPSNIFSPEGGCSEGLDAFRFFFKYHIIISQNILVRLSDVTVRVHCRILWFVVAQSVSCLKEELHYSYCRYYCCIFMSMYVW